MTGFELLCNYIESNEECQFSAAELVEKLQEFTVGDAYSEKQTIRKLQERYGCNVVVAVKAGGKTIVCFQRTAVRILSDKWCSERKSDPSSERLRVVKAAAAIIRQDIRGAVFNTQLYPDVEQIRGEGAELLPETVRVMIQDIIGGKGKAAASKAAYLQQCLVSAARPRSYVSPLKHGLAVLLHTRYGSRDLIRLLSSVGAVADYSETLAFETSAALACARCEVQPDAFEQYIADNADHDVRTLDGHSTFHTMGMVKSVTPSTAVSYPEAIPRGKTSAPACRASHLAKVPIYIYPAPAISGLQCIRVERIDLSVGLEAALYFRRLNSLWLSAHWAEVDKCPGWNGYMASAFQAEEGYSVSMVIPLLFMQDLPLEK